MNKFEDLNFKPHAIGNGLQATMIFENKRGVSVVKFNGSYGNELGLWELAVLDENGGLDYSTEITDDVLGHLTEQDVSDVMGKVQLLE